MNKKKNIIIISSTISIIIILSIVLLISLINHKTTSKENAYGNFENAVIFSDTLDYILSEDFDKYTIEAIENITNDYFISLYPSGAGIGYVSYNTAKDNYSLRIIDSHGIFHTLTIHKNEDKVNIKIDDFEKDYEIEEPNREEED